MIAIIDSRARRAVLSALLLAPDQEFYLSELVRRTGFSPRPVQLAVAHLVRTEIILDRRDGNRRYFRANRQNPLFADLRQILLKTDGLGDQVALALETGGGVEFAFIFGSIAAGTATSGSDVDLLVVGDAGLQAIVKRLRDAHDALGREINPVVWTRAEWDKRLKSGDHFLSRILAGPRLLIVRGDHVPEAVAGKSVTPGAPDLPPGNRKPTRRRGVRAHRRGKRPRS